MFRLTRAGLGFAFWIFFILSAAVLISGLITSAIVIDLLLALIVIALGFHGVLEEYDHKQAMHALKKIDESLRQLGEWIEKANLFMRSMAEKHELRMHHLDTKRSLAEQKSEKNAKELSRRIIDLENKLNSVRKTLAGEKYKPLTSFEKRVARIITSLRKEGMITSSVYSRRMRVSAAIARNDLKKMAGMKIVRKRGTGRNAYYILAA